MRTHDRDALRKEPLLKKNAFLSVCLVVAMALAACAPAPHPLSLGVLSAVDADTLAPGLLKVGDEQRAGYDLIGGGVALALNFQPESAQQDELQMTVRSMVEGRDQPMLGLVGATSNESTLRVAALSNFFNVPMLVPSAAGDHVLPENNLWAFRLSAPGSAHAEYLFGSLITRQAVSDLTAAEMTPATLRLSIIYEQNTFGEGTAVAAARAAMAQDIEIAQYASFAPDSPDETSLNTLLAVAKERQVHVVYFVSSNPDAARRLVGKFQNGFEPEQLPVLIGQSGAFASSDFLAAPEAEGVFILRQQIVPDLCPEGITSLAGAQSYAALYILDFAVSQTRDQPQFQRIDSNNLRQAREAVRDHLKGLSLTVPCLGLVAFDNAGQNRNLQFEMTRMATGTLISVTPGELQQAIGKILTFDPTE